MAKPKKGRWSFPTLLRTLLIALVMSTVSAFFGVLVVIIGMNVLDLPPRYPFPNSLWVYFIVVGLSVGTIVAEKFYRDVFPEEYQVKYRDETNAILVMVLVALGVVAFEVLFPSGGTETAIDVLVASVFSIVLSVAIYATYERKLRELRPQEEGE